MGFFQDWGNAVKSIYSAPFKVGEWIGDGYDALTAPSDQQKYMEQLQQQLAQLASQMPNMSDYYKQQAANISGSVKPFQSYNFTQIDPSQMQKYSYDPLGTGAIDRLYNLSTQNLNRTMGQQMSDASQSAGARASAGGYLNKNAFVQNAQNSVRQAFAPQFSQLEADRARSLADIERYNNQMLNNVNNQNVGLNNNLMQYNNQGLNSANQYNTSGMNSYNQWNTGLLADLARMQGAGMQQDWANKMGLFNAQAGMSQYYDPYTMGDKLLNFGSNAIKFTVPL